MGRSMRWAVRMAVFGLLVFFGVWAVTGSIGWALVGLVGAGIAGNMLARPAARR